ncbi:Organic solvent tolerance protein [alpha proteobacterium HIMB5]|nr:Organic solvent tolerance protein [alpha proteobacterium HIMB5]
MKNKGKIFFLLLISIFFIEKTSSEEKFIFESKSIEFLNSNNLIKASDGVTISDQTGIIIESKNSEYDKLKGVLKLNGDVFIKDKINDLNFKSDNATYFANDGLIEFIDNIQFKDLKKNIQVESEKITYQKTNEKIISENSTLIKFEPGYFITGKNVTYDNLKLKLFSKNKAILKDNLNNEIEIENFQYSFNDKILKSEKLNFKDYEGNKYNTGNAIIDLSNQKIASKDIEILYSKGELGENAKLKGKSLLMENNITNISKGIFTTCKINNNCAPWSIKSEKITHNKSKKTIYYDNSVFQLYDFPVFYFPKFFHPDPTVKRQSGFLTPSLMSSSTIGNSIKIPYYQVVSEDKDFTFTPRIFSNYDILLQNEYRQVNKHTNHISDFSVKKLNQSNKTHFFSNTKIDLSNELIFSDLEFNIEKTSNDTYLKKNKITSNTRSSLNQSLLNSFIKYNASTDDLKISTEFQVFEDLTKDKNSDKFQYIYPNFSISKLIQPKSDIKGELNYQISGSNIQKDTNIRETSIINDLNYSSDNFFSKFGTKSNLDLLFKNTLKKGDNSSSYDKNTKNEIYTAAIFNSSYPLKKLHNNNFISNLTPKILARYSPNNNENLTNSNRKINSTNIFSNNRLGIGDSIEGGQSITIGLDYNYIDNNNNEFLNFSINQIFRDEKDFRLPLKSTMQNKSSDLVGNFNFYPNQNFKIYYDFSMDNNFDTMNYNKLNSEFTVNNFITSFEFLEENNDIGTDSYLKSDLKYLINNSSSIGYNTRRNRKTNLTEYYNLIYEYKNDCLIAAIEYNKDYYQDRDLAPSEEIFFKLTITPFTSVNSPNLK